MKVLQIIHGYPLLYNAGSEVYTQTLTQELAKNKIEVQVFSREENPFSPDFTLKKKFDEFSGENEERIRIPIHLINVSRQKDRFVSKGVDEKLNQVLKEFKPDLVHIQHLNHLSLTLIDEIFNLGIPIIYTLHDYWLSCPRGQFLQINYGFDNPHAVCDGQDDRKCAIHCYSRYMTGLELNDESDLDYWTHWVSQRQLLIDKLINKIDMFISPSLTVMNRIKDELNISKEKVIYLDYGFDIERLSNRKREKDDLFTFGYIGTHTVAKGIDLLIRAFSKLEVPARLRIWGREREDTSSYLKYLIKDLKMPVYLEIEWMKEYNNFDILNEVFNKTDAIVVPSIWDENSPLVIHESLQAGVLVITANQGGMVECVENKVNGLLFEHRDVDSIYEQLDYAIANKFECEEYSRRGYIQSNDGNVVSIEDHVDSMIKIYNDILDARKKEVEIGEYL